MDDHENEDPPDLDISDLVYQVTNLDQAQALIII